MQIIAIDFDGTLAKHEYPDIGEEVPEAVRVVKKLQSRGDQLILFTMRSREQLVEAVQWCEDRGINLYAVNHNPDQRYWTESPKVYAHIYIDDAAIGCPLIEEGDGRPYVDWLEIERMLGL